MTTTINKLFIAAGLLWFVVTACDKARVTENGGHAVELTRHGNTACVLVDNKVLCAPATMRAPMRMASSTAI
jgi:hypothetical protein